MQRLLILRDQVSPADVRAAMEHRPDVVLCARGSYGAFVPDPTSTPVLAVRPSSMRSHQMVGGLAVAAFTHLGDGYDSRDIASAPSRADIVFAPNDAEPMDSPALRRYMASVRPVLCVRGDRECTVREHELGGEMISELSVSSWAVVDVDTALRDCRLVAAS